jgi:hypothetical protein
MDAAPLVARFVVTYVPALVLSGALLVAAGSQPSTGSNLLVFLGCLFWATGPIKTSQRPGLPGAPDSLIKALTGIVAIDALAQAAFIGYVFEQLGRDRDAWRYLPFIFVTVVIVQGLLAYGMLKRRASASA